MRITAEKLAEQVVLGLVAAVAVAWVVGRAPGLRQWINAQWKDRP